jgi:deoxyhypusine synthase
MIYFHSYRNPGLIIDVVGDIRLINTKAAFAKKSGIIILGGGVIKHHICNANLYRNGADFAVFINTMQEYDGSDSGARPDEAVSWGKIRLTSQPVKVVRHHKQQATTQTNRDHSLHLFIFSSFLFSPLKIYAEASLVFPLLVAQTFVKHWIQTRKENK